MVHKGIFGVSRVLGNVHKECFLSQNIIHARVLASVLGYGVSVWGFYSRQLLGSGNF